MSKSKYIARLHCHQKVLLDLVRVAANANTSVEKKEIRRRLLKLQKSFQEERFDIFVRDHIFNSDSWHEVMTDFLFFIKRLVKR